MGNFAVADLHGCYTQWRQIQSFCKDSDRIFVLGDCIDRSLHGFDTLKSVLNDPRTTLLCGNHEDMMLQALIADRDWEFDQDDDMAFYRWFNNGGKVTYDDWQQEGRDFNWISVLQHLPLWAKYTNQEGQEITMTHSGVTPKVGWDISSVGRKPLLWDRDHLRALRWHRSDNEIVVHGHTTSISLLEKLNILKETDIDDPVMIKYCQGHKIDIDLCSYYTGICCLLDLDSLQPIYFNSEGKINDSRSLEVDSGIRKLVPSV